MGKSNRKIPTTKKPKEVYRKIMDTRLCDVEHRKVLFEYLRMSMKQHYPTIFGDISDNRIEFVFGEDGTLLMRIYGEEFDGSSDYYEDAPYEYEVWRILTHIPLDNKDEWCFETFVNEMN